MDRISPDLVVDPEMTHRAGSNATRSNSSRRDVARLIVSVLESGDASLAAWLQTGDAYPLIIDDAECIHIAVAEGCWSAALALLESFRRERKARKSLIHTVRVRTLDTTPFGRVVTLLETLPFVFPSQVIYRVAERGDLPTLQWFHQTEGFDAQEAMRRAARAKRFDVVEWLVNATPWVKCVLTLAESGTLRAICCTCAENVGSKVALCAVTERHGYTEVTTFVPTMSGPVKACADVPLADPFAACGDLASLEAILKLPMATQIFTSEAILKAAAAGRLAVVQWLVSSPIRQWSLTEAASVAAKHGHLAIVQWLFEFPETNQSFILSHAIEGSDLETCRWILHRLPPLQSGLVQSYPHCKAAGISKNPELIAFIRNKGAIEFSLQAVQSMGVDATRRHIENVLNERVLARADVTTALLERVAEFGTAEALTYMVAERGLWSRQLFTHAARSTEDGLEKVQFVWLHASVRAEWLHQPLTECLDVDVKDLFGLVLSGGFKVAMWLLETIPECDNASAFQVADASRPASSYPNCIPHIAEELVAPAPEALVTVSQLSAFVLAFIASRPGISRTIRWLPQVAVRLNSEAAFTRLGDIGHPDISSESTLNAIIKYSRNPRLLVELLTNSLKPDWDIKAIEWVARFALLSVLQLLCRRAASTPPDHQLVLMQTAIESAVMTGQVEVLEWVWATGCLLFGGVDPSVVFRIDLRTASAHARAVQWFDDHSAAQGG